MAVNESQIRAQLPPGAQKSIGNEKDIAGVIDESIGGDSDVLLNQARMMARARRGVMYEGGGNFDDDFVRQNVLRTPKEFINRSLSTETIQQLTQGQLNRDQQYIGNNSDWTGYYLEPLAKFVVPCHGAAC